MCGFHTLKDVQDYGRLSPWLMELLPEEVQESPQICRSN